MQYPAFKKYQNIKICLLLINLLVLTACGGGGGSGDDGGGSGDATIYQSPQTLGLERLGRASQIPINVSFNRGVPRTIRLDLPINGASAEESARQFLTDYADLLAQTSEIEQSSARQLSFVTRYASRITAPEPLDVVRFAQTYDGVPVFGAEIVVGVLQPVSGTSRIIHTGGVYMGAPRAAVDLIPAITEQDALAAARTYLQRPDATAKSAITRVIYDPKLEPTLIPTEGEPRLAWLIAIGNGEPYEILIDAHDSSVLLASPLFSSAYDDFDLDLEDANGGNMADTNCFNPTTLDDEAGDEDGVYSEYQNDEDATNGRVWAIDIADWYYDKLDQRSMDNDDGEVEFYIHAGLDPPNANHVGNCGIQFSTGLMSQDIVAHEFTHGVVYHSSKLAYRFQSGALSESYADTMAALSESSVDWTVGDGRLDGGGIIRSLQDPPSFNCGNGPCPDTISGWFISPDTDDGDSGGVHTNSSIINKAHYLISVGTGPITFNGTSVNGMGSFKTRRLLYWVIKSLSPQSGFIEARETTISLAQMFVQLGWYSFDSGDVCTVRNAFGAVEVGFGDFDCDGIENTFDDPDGDFIHSNVDNCPNDNNPGQLDFDQDGIGAVCDDDDDMDGVEDSVDNCFQLYNPGQQNTDDDALGNKCDPDNDNDNVDDVDDNCPGDPNPDQFDGNNNNMGDACDPDHDGDGFYTDTDNCPFIFNPAGRDGFQPDSDGDGVGNACDLCPTIADNAQSYTSGIPELGIDPQPFQPDTDDDGTPDACDLTPTGTGMIVSVDGGAANPTTPTEIGSTVPVSVQNAEPNTFVDIPVLLCPVSSQPTAEDSDRVEITFSGLDNAITASIIDGGGQRITDTRESSSAIRGMRIRPDCSTSYKVRLEFGSAVSADENFQIAIAASIDNGINPWTVDYTVSTTSGANGLVMPASATVTSGNTANFSITADSGYSIDTVSGCSGSLAGTTYSTGPVTADCTVTANFSLIAPTNYTVSSIAGANGMIVPASIVIPDGNATNFTVTPNSGYNIDSVTGCSGTLNGATFTTGAITANCTVSASFILTGGPVAAAIPSLSFEPVKIFRFSWTDVTDATFYRLLENADGNSGFVQIGIDIPQSTEIFDHSTSLHRRVNAQYLLQSCNAQGCTDSEALTVNNNLASSIGYFKASNTPISFFFGEVVSISDDGNTLAVATSQERNNEVGINGNENNGSINFAGAVYVFTKEISGWSQQAYIKASNTEANDYFGWAMSLSGDGNTLAVGANREGGSSNIINGSQANDIANPGNYGAAYVFTRTGTNWTQQAYIKPSTNTSGTRRLFGTSVGLSFDGDVLAVGQLFGNAGGGSAFIFTRSGTTWSEQTILNADISEDQDEFGNTLALSSDGNTLAVTAENESSDADGINGDQTNNLAPSSGAVYVFSYNGIAWSQQAYVKASNSETSDRFGTDLSLNANGDTLAVGAHLEDSAATGIDGDQSDNSAGNNTTGSGAVYLFIRNGNSWSQQSYIKPDDTLTNDQFGYSVNLSSDGNMLVVGARLEDSNKMGVSAAGDSDTSRSNSGAAYLFQRDAGVWGQTAYIKASNASAGFGWSVSMNADGTSLAVGATTEQSQSTGVGGDQTSMPSDLGRGAVYLY